MKFGRYGWPHRLMRWGLGIVFLWIGFDIFRHPADWIGFVPQGFLGGLSRENALQVNGIVDMALGAVLLLGWWPRLASGIAALHLAAILVTQGINATVIRDVGLLGTALALFVWPQHRRSHRFKLPFFGRKKHALEEEL